VTVSPSPSSPVDNTQIITVGGMILGVLIAYLQIQKNQRAALVLQEEHLRNELKLKVYEKAAAVFADVSGLLVSASSLYRSPINSLDMRVRKGFPVSPTSTPKELSDAVHIAAAGITRVLLVLEEYEIVFARFRSFRRRLSADHSRLLDAHNAVWSKLMLFLPVIHAETGEMFGPVSFPSEVVLADLERLNEEYVDVCNVLSGYMIDLQIEAQNELMGKLFARQLPPRHPNDPSVEVLGRDAEEVTERPAGRLI
jgi:hypothetical protein